MRPLTRTLGIYGILSALTLAGAVAMGGCSHGRGWVQVDAYGNDGYRHRGYYDNNRYWHGGWYDNDRRYHPDPREWHDRDWRDGRR